MLLNLFLSIITITFSIPPTVGKIRQIISHNKGLKETLGAFINHKHKDSERFTIGEVEEMETALSLREIKIAHEGVVDQESLFLSVLQSRSRLAKENKWDKKKLTMEMLNVCDEFKHLTASKKLRKWYEKHHHISVKLGIKFVDEEEKKFQKKLKFIKSRVLISRHMGGTDVPTSGPSDSPTTFSGGSTFDQYTTGTDHPTTFSPSDGSTFDQYTTGNNNPTTFSPPDGSTFDQYTTGADHPTTFSPSDGSTFDQYTTGADHPTTFSPSDGSTFDQYTTGNNNPTTFSPSDGSTFYQYTTGADHPTTFSPSDGSTFDQYTTGAGHPTTFSPSDGSTFDQYTTGNNNPTTFSPSDGSTFDQYTTGADHPTTFSPSGGSTFDQYTTGADHPTTFSPSDGSTFDQYTTGADHPTTFSPSEGSTFDQYTTGAGHPTTFSPSDGSTFDQYTTGNNNPTTFSPSDGSTFDQYTTGADHPTTFSPSDGSTFDQYTTGANYPTTFSPSDGSTFDQYTTGNNNPTTFSPSDSSVTSMDMYTTMPPNTTNLLKRKEGDAILHSISSTLSKRAKDSKSNVQRILDRKKKQSAFFNRQISDKLADIKKLKLKMADSSYKKTNSEKSQKLDLKMLKLDRDMLMRLRYLRQSSEKICDSQIKYDKLNSQLIEKALGAIAHKSLDELNRVMSSMKKNFDKTFGAQEASLRGEDPNAKILVFLEEGSSVALCPYCDADCLEKCVNDGQVSFKHCSQVCHL